MSTESAGTWRVSGKPTDTELAAVLAAITAAAAAAAAAPSTQPQAEAGASGWSAYWRGLRQALPTGSDAWTASGQPQA